MDRILTTHVGSLVRPGELLEFVAARETGRGYDVEAHRECLDRVVADVVDHQLAVGLDIVNDGEMGKEGWITYLYGRLTGIESRAVPADGESVLPPSRDRLHFPGFYAEHDATAVVEAATAQERRVWVCTGPIGYDPSAVREDIDRLIEALEGREHADAFLPVLAPASAYWLRDEHYGSEEEFVFALAEAMGEEYRTIVDAGLMVQVDDAVLMHERDSILALGGTDADYRRWAQLRVEALNHALRGIPPERVRYHVCWGSNHGPHAYDPPLKDVIDLILQVDAGCYAIEQANPRHEHEWAIWQDVTLPEGRKLIPGVVTHHAHVVEHPELVAQRLVRLADVVGRENVIGGTDCGFAQGAFIRRVHPEIQWAKLQSLAEGARIASRRLWDSPARA